MNFHRIKFLAFATQSSIEVYAWAPKPYHKFMAFKVRLVWYIYVCIWLVSCSQLDVVFCCQSFPELKHQPVLLNMTIEKENSKLKVCYASKVGQYEERTSEAGVPKWKPYFFVHYVTVQQYREALDGEYISVRVVQEIESAQAWCVQF